ncbi:MAG: hypothetical protein M3Y77_02850 [Actinomycetota bacterium]|nr:hypothetical protein [Actinomycetota bacterium]
MSDERSSPSDIIEEIVDELSMSALGQRVAAFRLTRMASGTLVLDYGDGSRFVLTVVKHSRVDGSRT